MNYKDFCTGNDSWVLFNGKQFFLLTQGLRFRSTKTKTPGKLVIDKTQESFPVQNAFFVILSRKPYYKSKAASVRILPAVPE